MCAGGWRRCIQRYSDFRAVAAADGVLSGMVHEDLAHQVGGDAAKMGSVSDGAGRRLNKPQVNLVEQAGCLKRVVGPLASEIAPRQAPQLPVSPRDERV